MIPEHYSRDIAQRCQSLIRSLLPAVQGGLADDGRFGGPLSTTFLLAMATPMVVLPIERIVKPAHPGAAQVGDDRQLDPALVQEVDNVLGHARTFGAAPFVVPGRWSYVSEYPPFNIAHQWPPELLESLGRPDAYEMPSALPPAASCAIYATRSPTAVWPIWMLRVGIAEAVRQCSPSPLREKAGTVNS